MNRYLSDEVTELEKENAKISLEVALEGIVLLKNDGILPLKTNKIALYGSGARYTVKGGTGSVDVNNRYNISIEEGLEKEGFIITTKRWLNDCEKQYKQRVLERENKIREIGLKYIVNDDTQMSEINEPPIVVNYFYHSEITK